MNTVYNNATSTENQHTTTVADLQDGTNAAESAQAFDKVHPITDMLIRSRKSVKIDSIVYYMVMMMVALVSLTVYFYTGLV